MMEQFGMALFLILLLVVGAYCFSTDNRRMVVRPLDGNHLFIIGYLRIRAIVCIAPGLGSWKKGLTNETYVDRAGEHGGPARQRPTRRRHAGQDVSDDA